jgi:hypothetical protein
MATAGPDWELITAVSKWTMKAILSIVISDTGVIVFVFEPNGGLERDKLAA